MLLALAAAGVTVALVLGILGAPVVGTCSGDTRGLVACVRDMADRKFKFPGQPQEPVAEGLSQPTGPVTNPGTPMAVGYWPFTAVGDPRVEGYSMTGIDLLFQWNFKRR